ncbi:MAG: chorismate-binding protein [Cytophagaceae bacterium]
MNIINQTLNLEDLFFAATNHNLPVAIWSLPESKSKQLIIDLYPSYNNIADNIEDYPEGFIFNPFDIDKKGYFIKASVSFDEANKKLFLKVNDTEKFNEIFDKIPQQNFPFSEVKSTSKEEYISNVNKAIATITNEELKKVVLARNKTLELPENYNPVTIFNKLCSDYPDAFNSLCYIPGEGMWLGSSPEILVSKNKGGIFKTIALAGTQASKSGASLSEAVWKQKEIEEQALVSRYIINCFKHIRLREFEEEGPRTVMAGNLMHLCTDFYVNINEVNFPYLTSTMLRLLHPTSAVCGMPKDSAAAYISATEGFDRTFYSGYLGPVNIQNEINIFVNIRCCNIKNQKAILFAGAGITKDSNPEKEWEETELKLKIIESKLI